METLQKEDCERIIFEHDFQKNIINESLELVKNFILRNKRILVGGMGMDFALKNKGSQLYSANKVPDYDFYSSEFHKDAYEIGEQLGKKFTGVSVIPGRHSSTMRVRVNFVPVADVTYIPANLYGTIPTLTYQGFIIVHPHYQMIDQHRALSLPYEEPPHETIVNRWKKDIERYDLLCKYYQIDSPKIKDNLTYTNYSLSTATYENTCLGGYASLLYWEQYAAKEGFMTNDALGSLTLDLDAKTIDVKLVKDAPLTLITDDFVHMLDVIKCKDPKYQNAILDKIPRRILCDNREIIDNRGRLLSAHEIASTVYVSNLQDVMCYMLTKGVMYKDSLALAAYKRAQAVLYWASDHFAKTSDKKWLVYLPSTTTYGQFNWSDSYFIQLNSVLEIMNFGNNGEGETSIYSKKSVPKAAYPEKNKAIKETLYEFNPSESPLYQFDGAETEAESFLMKNPPS